MFKKDINMREWQVGDPIGDGNDIGVPDTKYMGYLRDNDDESSKEDIVDNFKQYINYARDYYNMQHYEDAFYYLDYSFRTYGKMNTFEKSQVRDNPFNQDWIIELCCKIINNHGEYYQEATDFIIKNKYHVKLCMDCDCVYTTDYNCCIKCGKPLTEPAGKSPEKIAEELSDILGHRIYDEFEIARLVNRSLVLMKSNDCRLVEIADRNNIPHYKYVGYELADWVNVNKRDVKELIKFFDKVEDYDIWWTHRLLRTYDGLGSSLYIKDLQTDKISKIRSVIDGLEYV